MNEYKFLDLANCEIRLANMADENVIVEIAKAAFACYLPRMDRPPFPMLANYAGFINLRQAWVMEAGAQIIAFLVLADEPDGSIMIDTIAVLPCFQQKGLGRLLVEFAVNHALQKKADRVRVYTNAAMIENLRWYEKLGFYEIGRKVENGYNRVWLEKKLYFKSSNGQDWQKINFKMAAGNIEKSGNLQEKFSHENFAAQLERPRQQ